MTADAVAGDAASVENPDKNDAQRPKIIGDPATTTDEEFRDAIRAEYSALRSQIEKTDGVCQIVLFALFTAALAMAKVATDAISAKATAPAAAAILGSTASGAVWLISFLWLAGYLFLSEKRHVIVKTAYYISSRLEPRHPGLGWERWHLGNVEGRSFWRWDPHYLETTISTVVLALGFLFMVSLEGRRLTVWIAATVATDLAFLFFAVRSVWYYRMAVIRLKNPPALHMIDGGSA